MSGKRKSLPSIWDIHGFWIGQGEDATRQESNASIPLSALLINVRHGRQGGVQSAEIGCFACGRPDVQRAHIQARSTGGSDSPDNLHLLCKGCHAESEMLSGTAYWRWFRSQTRDGFLEHYARRRGYGSWDGLCHDISALMFGCRWDAPDFEARLRSTGWDACREKLVDEGHDPYFIRDIMMSLDEMVSGNQCDWFSAVLGEMARRNHRSSTSHRVKYGRRPVRIHRPAFRAAPSRQRKKADTFALEHGPALQDLCTAGVDAAAEMMTASEVLTPSGGVEWTPGTVRRVLKRYEGLAVRSM